MLILTSMPGWFLETLRFGGGLFLLYLARAAYVAARQKPDFEHVLNKPVANSIMQATVLNFLNPNPYIFWSLIGGPILLKGWQQGPGCYLAFLGGMYAALISGCGCLVILFATTARLGSSVNRALLSISAAGLALFGCYQLFAALTAIMHHFS